ncbi:L-seryl-tRNA(Sec) selenium transferase [hydrothermal vent metagenome]|uniref:L-seryl-tRNA(Sec) selenium transferase n=1 Tax=hydrothermal vent metagenome TaxID=652676 RepID=A0A3B1BE69_9ZZZZ
MTIQDKLRRLPSIDKILSHQDCEPLVGRYGRAKILDMMRHILDEARKKAQAGDYTPLLDSPSAFIAKAALALEADSRSNMTKVVNCTGVVVHTNLGRALLAKEATQAAALAGSHSVNLEYRIDEGERGERDELVEGLITRLTGAEAATVVNNNAAAIFLALNTLSEGKETLVSRGELIEIGGSFRLPEIMRKSGCLLREVGTTNRTHLTDYEDGITGDTALIMRAHPSNFSIVGFTSQPGYQELANLAGSKVIPFIVDLGSGALIDMEPLGLGRELTVQKTLEMGADIVTFSGDKLLGGPQAGIIAGARELIDRIRKNHLKRILRCGKMTLASLEATLRLYQHPELALRHIPTLRALSRDIKDIRRVATKVAGAMETFFGEEAEVTVIDDICRAGSGAAPQADIPSVSVAIKHSSMNPNQLARWFRQISPPVAGRVEADLFRLDIRLVEDEKEITDSLPH